MLNHDSPWYQDFTNCTVLKESRYKRLLRGPVDEIIPHKSCLIKIYFYPGLWQRVKYVFRESKASKEKILSGLAGEKGIPTIVPLKIKDIRKRGFPNKSIVLVEYLPDCANLEELLLKKPVADRLLRRKIIKEYGKLARRIHDQGILQEDFDPNNILCQQKPGDSFQLYLIDFEKTRIVKELTSVQRVHSLAKLNRMGQKLGQTDQMRFLTAYLGPQAARQERRQWARRIKQEEKLVFLKDQRRARRKCTTKSKKIGLIKYDEYQGYFRKRHHSQNYYTRTDITDIIQSIEKNMPTDVLKQTMPEDFLDITAQLYDREETFQVRFFKYGGIKYRFPGGIKRTPLIAAWQDDNSLLKNRTAGFFPVAAVEKRIAWNRYHGFLIRRRELWRSR